MLEKIFKNSSKFIFPFSLLIVTSLLFFKKKLFSSNPSLKEEKHRLELKFKNKIEVPKIKETELTALIKK